VGPTFKGLYGRTVELEDGSTVVADEEYIRRSIEDPSAQVVQGYPDAMPSHDLSDDEVDALILFLREELGDD
jgi:cytochrome c oxidase subunit 2